MRTLVIFAFLVATCCAQSTPHFDQFLEKERSSGPEAAAAALQAGPLLLTDRSNILAVAVLHTHSWGDGNGIVKFLSMLKARLANTKTQPYVFYRDPPTPTLMHVVNETFGGWAQFIRLTDAEWELPEGRARNKTLWKHADQWNGEYRKMGHWRLTYPFRFTQSMGHKYVLMIDADSDIIETLNFDLVATAKSKDAHIVSRSIVHETPFISVGLAELARYYIVTNDYTPSTLLWNDCRPSDITGLYTGGWQRTVIYGNFVMVSIDFWFRHDVQAFVDLVIASGDHVVRRWVDQDVIGMIRLMFVTEPHDLTLNFRYQHKGEDIP